MGRCMRLWKDSFVRVLTPLLNRLPLVLFIVAVVAAGFVFGIYVERSKVFPYRFIERGQKTFLTLFESVRDESDPFRNWALRFVDVPPDQVESHRIKFVDAEELAAPILFSGYRGQFAEYCGDHLGCIAVEYDSTGEVAHAYPYRPDEIHAANMVDGFPYELSGNFSFDTHSGVAGMTAYPNGDLLVVFHFRYSFPYAGGLARIGRDGRPLWYRQDYSHHWPYISGGDGLVFVPSLRLSDDRISVVLGPGDSDDVRELSCDSVTYVDYVNVLDGEGRVVEEISVLAALMESSYAPLLLGSWDPCDPTHLNFVHEIGKDVSIVDDMAPGDLVVSLRNLSAFAVLDRSTGDLKRVVRGDFFGQHGVQHFDGSKFMMFDNLGGYLGYGPSRLLMVDLSNGESRTIFPTEDTPEYLQDLFSVNRGHISISPDNSRVIITFSAEGKALEVRIADGSVTAEFNSVHNVIDQTQFGDDRKTKALLYALNGIYYVDNKEDYK